MPQIYIIIAPRAKGAIVPMLPEIDRLLTRVVIDTLGAEVNGDVSCTAVEAVYAQDEGDLQVEIRFTVGGDEYHIGQVFDPSEETLNLLKRNLIDALQRILPGVVSTFSVWVIPIRGTMFHYQVVSPKKP